MGQEFNLEFPTHLKVNPNESVDGIRLRFGTSTELIQTTKETSHPHRDVGKERSIGPL